MFQNFSDDNIFKLWQWNWPGIKVHLPTVKMNAKKFQLYPQWHFSSTKAKVLMDLYHPGFQPLLLSFRPFQHCSFFVASDGTQVVGIVLLGRVFVEKPHFPLMFWTISSNFKRVVPSGTKTCSIFLFKGCSAVSLGLSYEIPLPSWVKKSLCRIETH